MNWLILNAHRFLLRIVVTITTLTVALSVSFLVQQLDWIIRSDPDRFLLFPIAGLAVILAFLSIPRLNGLVVAPYKARHIFVQVGVCLCGAVLITWTGLIAFQAPLAIWLTSVNIAPLLALGCGALFICLGILGSLRAVWPEADKGVSDSMATLRKVHFVSRALAAAFAFASSGIILGSVLILKSPTTTITINCSIIMWCFAAFLGSSRLSVANFEKPVKLWNIALQFFVVFIAIFFISIFTRALAFHTHLFERQSEIDAVYPRLENLLMLPFIIFGLTSIALALAFQKEESDDVVEVFA